MFKGRTIQVGLAKPSTDVAEESIPFADKATIVSVCVDSAVKKIGFAVAGYVLLDTFRKVMIARAIQGGE